MKSGMCDLVILCFVQLLQPDLNIAVCDIIKRHTGNKDTRLCIEMYEVACFLELTSSEGPWQRALSIADRLSYLQLAL